LKALENPMRKKFSLGQKTFTFNLAGCPDSVILDEIISIPGAD
jgi:hypothetical protein